MRLSFRMKGAIFGLGAKAMSVVMIALMFLSIFISQWQKTALLTVFIPPQSSSHLAPRIAGGEIEETVNRVEVKTNYSSAVLEKYIPENKKICREDGSTPRAIGEVQREDKQLVKDNCLRHSGKNSDPVVSVNSASTYINSSISRKDDENLTAVEDDVQGRNITKGKWVVDKKRPLYSGFGCKRWLSSMWACRTSQRKDFAYEKLRWQPKNFQMEEFEASKFLRRMKDKTLAFVGDSLGRQQFQSLMCMISAGEEQNVKDVGKDYGLVLAPGSKRPEGWAYNFPTTNTTVLYYWSASLCDLEPINKTNRDTDYAMHLDRPPGFLQKFIHKFDVLVLNTGHHWNRGKLKANRWVVYVGGKPNSDKKIALLSKAKNLTVHSIVQWVNSQLPHNPNLKAFYRTISPRHFVGGEWNSGGSCDNTMPMSIGKEVLQDKSSDEMAAMAVKGTGVKLLDITALSQVRDEAHISRFSRSSSIGPHDCLHWCLPGVPDTWNEILFAQI